VLYLLSKKTLNHFADFAIVNELLITENRRISARGRIGLSQTLVCPHGAGSTIAAPLLGTRGIVYNDAGISYI